MLGLKRPQPKTRLGIYLRRCERVLVLLALAYLALLIFPQVLFADSVTVDNITVYSRERLPPETAQIVAQAAALVRASELAVAGRHERIFICNSAAMYRLFAPIDPTSFANSNPVANNIFVADADLANNIARNSAPDYNRRALAPVLAHEITHGLVQRRLGRFRALRLPAWIAEGYPDYVARESSFPENVGLRLIAAGQRDPSPSFDYFLYRQMIRHLIEDEHLSFAQLVSRADDFDRIERETRLALARRAR